MWYRVGVGRVLKHQIVMPRWRWSENFSRSVVSNSWWPHGLWGHRTFQTRILEWVAISCCRGSSWLKANYSREGSDGKCFRVCGSHSAYSNHSVLLLQHKSSLRQYIKNTRAWLGSEILLLDNKIWTSYNFRIMKYFYFDFSTTQKCKY